MSPNVLSGPFSWGDLPASVKYLVVSAKNVFHAACVQTLKVAFCCCRLPVFANLLLCNVARYSLLQSGSLSSQSFVWTSFYFFSVTAVCKKFLVSKKQDRNKFLLKSLFEWSGVCWILTSCLVWLKSRYGGSFRIKLPIVRVAKSPRKADCRELNTTPSWLCILRAWMKFFGAKEDWKSRWKLVAFSWWGTMGV